MYREVCILGLYDTGLYAGQLYGEAGIKVTGIDCDRSKPGFYSRYIKAILGPDPVTHEDDLVRLLVQQSSNKSTKPLLIASSELYLGFLNSKRDVLRKLYTFDIPDTQVLEKVLSKSGQFVMATSSGFLVPSYIIVENDSDLPKLNILRSFPVIIKGDNQLVWKAHKLSKSYIVHDISEMHEVAKRLLGMQVPFIAQELVHGPITNNYEYNALCLDGRIVAESVIQKKRQYPIPFGAATMIEVVPNSQISEMGREFVLRNRIEGFSNTEFKYDPSTGQWLFIETNARIWLQIKLTKNCGVNYAMEYYNHKDKSNKVFEVKRPLKFHAQWMDLFGELMNLRDTRSIKNLRDMVLSYNNISSLGLLNLKDMGPFINVFTQRRKK